MKGGNLSIWKPTPIDATRKCKRGLTGIALFFAVLLTALPAGGQSLELVERLKDLSQQMQTCGQDMACIQKLTNEMMALQKQLQQQVSGHPTAFDDPGTRKPCFGYPQGFGGKYCIPVYVTVTGRNLKQMEARIFSGILPDAGKPYIKTHLAYDYEADGQGEMIYAHDFSEFSVIVIGSCEKTRISQLGGYWQRWDKVNKHMNTGTFHTGGYRVRRPFSLAIHYPLDTHNAGKTNLSLQAPEVEIPDKKIPTYSSGDINPNDENVNLSFIVTPERMRRFVEQKGFERAFKWREYNPGKDAWSDHEVALNVTFEKTCRLDRNVVFKDHFHGYLAKTSAGFANATSNSCNAVKSRLVEEQFLRELFPNKNIHRFLKKRGLCAPSNLQRLAVTLWNNIFTGSDTTTLLKVTDKTGKFNFSKYFDSLNDGQIDLLLKSYSLTAGGAQAGEVMNTSLGRDCSIFARNKDGSEILIYMHPNSHPSIEDQKRARNGQQIIRNNYQKDYGREVGDVFFDADFSHEMKHAQECPDLPMGLTMDELGEAEKRAYTVSEAALRKWLKANCP